MNEVEIKFKREGREGLVAVGTYLSDAAKRFGVHLEEACSAETETHFCTVTVTQGSELLSADTEAEMKYFKERKRSHNERLACQAKIEGPGEVVIMTSEKEAEESLPKTESNTGDHNEQYRKEFAEMPLEKKIANLVQLETIALSETVSFIINSPFKIADKVMDVMAEFGFKKEEQEKKAARPAEHQAKSNGRSSDKVDAPVDAAADEASKDEPVPAEPRES
jgi:ferredoxin, 2Fe-2S